MSALPLLIISREGENPRSQPLDSAVSIGRGEGNVIRLEDRAVSRNHALVRKTSEGIQVEKQSDFAPIRLNGVECTRAILKEGDVVEIGPYRMRLDSKKEEKKPSAPVAFGKAAIEKSPEPVVEKTGKSGEISIEIQPESVVAAGAAVDSTVMLPELSEAIPQPDLMPTDQVAAENGTLDLAQPILGDSSGAEDGSKDPGTNIFDSPNARKEEGAEELNIDFGIQQPDAVSDLALEAAIPSIDEDGATRIQSVESVDVRLEIPSGLANVLSLDVAKDEILIGRGKECDIVLKDKKSSRKNTVIVRSGNRYRVKDLGSSNGTYLNGELVTEAELSANDVIRIGEVEINFHALNLDYEKAKDSFLPVEAPPVEVEEPAEFASSDALAVPAEVPADPAAIAPEGLAEAVPAPAPKKGIFGIYDKYIRNFKDLKFAQKLLVVLAVGLFLSWYFEDELGLSEPVAEKKPAQVQAKKADGSSAPVSLGYDSLSAEKKAQIDEAVRKATDFLRQQDFDKSIYEIQSKVYPILPEYAPAKEVERYAQEGKRRKEALEEEARRKEAEAKMKARIAELEAQTREFMRLKKYDEAKETFGEILAIDPDNGSVSGWKQEIDAWMEEQARLEQERLVQQEINKRAWDTYNEAFELHKGGKFREAIDIYKRVAELGSNDEVLLKKAKTMIRTCLDSLRDLRDPHLTKAKELEGSGDLSGAFKEYQKATEIDPSHADGWAGMERIRDVLTERAKILYTEAVIAESYSDFKTAHQKFVEIMAMAPEGSLYYQRAQRKMQSYLNFKSEEQSQ